MSERKAKYAVISPTGGTRNVMVRVTPPPMPPTPRQILDARISEADFQAQVIALAKMCGWQVFAVRQSAIEGKQLMWVRDRATRQLKQVAVRVSNVTASGYPDLTLVRGGKLIFWELKAEDGITSDAQKDWLAGLRATGHEAQSIRPSDWDYVERRLKGE